MIYYADMKDVHWLGDSQKVAHTFPKGVKLKLGRELTRVQLGAHPLDGDWLPEVGKGVQEIRIAHSREAYRVIYVATIGEYVYVLHAFHKKSKTGIATPRGEIELAKRRYREVVRSMS